MTISGAYYEDYWMTYHMGVGTFSESRTPQQTGMKRTTSQKLLWH